MASNNNVTIPTMIPLAELKRRKEMGTAPQPAPAQRTVTPQPAPAPRAATPQSAPAPQTAPVTQTASAPQQTPVQKNATQLICTSGYFKGKSYPLHGDTLIGRDVSAQLKYPSDYRGISRKHCTVYKNQVNGNVSLADMGSSMGTYIIGVGKCKPEKLYPLTPGMRFYLATTAEYYVVK